MNMIESEPTETISERFNFPIGTPRGGSSESMVHVRSKDARAAVSKADQLCYYCSDGDGVPRKMPCG